MRRLPPRFRTLRYVLIAVAAFALGSATVVQAVAPSGILGTVQLADRTDTTRLAAVDADGNVGVKVNNFAATQTVSGTVSVSNFPSTQNVSITGNTAASPIFVQDVDAAGKSAYVQGLCATDATCGLATVPAGKRFVIEQIAGQCNVGTGAAIEGFHLTAQFGGVDYDYWFHDRISADAGSGDVTLGPVLEHVLIYADGNLSARTYNWGGDASDSACALVLSGHLVSVP